jgi:hypothetical protein
MRGGLGSSSSSSSSSSDRPEPDDDIPRRKHDRGGRSSSSLLSSESPSSSSSSSPESFQGEGDETFSGGDSDYIGDEDWCQETGGGGGGAHEGEPLPSIIGQVWGLGCEACELGLSHRHTEFIPNPSDPTDYLEPLGTCSMGDLSDFVLHSGASDSAETGLDEQTAAVGTRRVVKRWGRRRAARKRVQQTGVGVRMLSNCIATAAVYLESADIVLLSRSCHRLKREMGHLDRELWMPKLEGLILQSSSQSLLLYWDYFRLHGLTCPRSKAQLREAGRFTSYLRMYAFSVQFLPMLGVWWWVNTRLRPQAALLVIKFAQGRLDAHLIEPVKSPSQVCGRYMSTVDYADRPCFSLSSWEDDPRSGCHVKCKGVPEYTVTAPGLIRISRPTELVVCIGPRSNPSSTAMFQFAKAAAPNPSARIEENCRGIPPREEDSQHAQQQLIFANVRGLFTAAYGPHGHEIIQVSEDSSSGCLEGLKLIGDNNVPSGKSTFRTTGPLELGAQHHCTCPGRCDCFLPVELKHITIVGCMRANTHTSHPGYETPAWGEGKIVFYRAIEERRLHEQSFESHRTMHAGLEMPSKLRSHFAASVILDSLHDHLNGSPEHSRLGILLVFGGPVLRTSLRLRPLCI